MPKCAGDRVNIRLKTLYPGTESQGTKARPFKTRDYRLFDIQQAGFPTAVPLHEIQEERGMTQQILNMKPLGWKSLKGTPSGVVLRILSRIL